VTSPSGSESRDVATWIAVVVLLVLVGSLLGLMALVTPHLLGVVLVIAGFVGFGALHYVVWGWWLRKSLMEAEPEEETSEREA
jgi:hypothetical protein